MKVCVVGTGYVGLVTGVCLAELGNEVICVDVDAAKLARLSRGEAVIYEQGLEEMLSRNIAAGRITFTTDMYSGVNASRVVFFAVGTPEGEDGSADLKHVLAVARATGQYIEGEKLVVVKSTVPVGTCERVDKEIRRALAARGVEIPFEVASNPEFLKEGSAILDFMKPDRVVAGVRSPGAEALLRELYEPLVDGDHPFIAMDVRSSEMTKYASNAMLATRISFINEIANICEKLGADVNDVRRGMAADSRIGKHFLCPGIGYGGSCFPKDVQALVHAARSAGYEPSVLDSVDALNERQKGTPARKALAWFEEVGIDPHEAKTAVWGVSFKPDTDDVREAPALANIEILLDAGVMVAAFDPVAMKNGARALNRNSGALLFANDAYGALNGADALLICTEWEQFRKPDFAHMKTLMRRSAIFDGRNLFEPATMHELGFVYRSIGRSAAT